MFTQTNVVRTIRSLNLCTRGLARRKWFTNCIQHGECMNDSPEVYCYKCWVNKCFQLTEHLFSYGPDYRPLIALCNDRSTFLLFQLFLSCWTSLKPFIQFFCHCKRSLHSLYKACACRSNSIWFSIGDLESIHVASPSVTQHKLANSLLRLK